MNKVQVPKIFASDLPFGPAPIRGNIEFEGNFATPPTSAETLRAIADSVSSNDDAMKLVFAGILRKAANELDAAQKDAERYQWLRDDNAYAPEESMIHGGAELDALCDEGIERSKRGAPPG